MTTHDDQPTKPRKRRRLFVRLTFGFVITILIPGLTYIWIAYDYTTIKPTPFVDVYAELNARHADYDESEKAWTVYFDAYYNHWFSARYDINRAINDFDDPAYKTTVNQFTSDHNLFGIPPEHELYFMVLETVEQLQPQIEAVRNAARLPVFGTPVVDVPNRQSILEFVPEWYPDPPIVDPLDSLPINEAILIQIGVSRGTARLLMLDARIALDDGDLKRVAIDARALFGIARQTTDEPTLIAPLISFATQRDACDLILQATQEYFGSDGLHDLLPLLPDLIQAREHPIRANFDNERLTHLDLIGRVYSDDGKGDGIVTIDGIHTMQIIASEEQTPPAVLAFAWPIQRRFAIKSQAIDQLDALIAAAKNLQSAGPGAIPAFINAIDKAVAREAGPKRHLLIFSIPASAWKRAIYTEHKVQVQLETTITLLALEHHRLDTGTYPNSLTDLVPAYLNTIPEDLFDPGQPIKYRLINNVPHLYSVGSDGDDDLARRPGTHERQDAQDFELRFADPAGPSPAAPDADWVIYPPAD